MSLKSKTIQGAKWSALSTVLVVGLGLLQMTVLARIISPSEFGLLSIAMVVIALADTLTDFGISNSIIQKKNITEPELTSLYWFNVFIGIFVFLFFFFLSDSISEYFNEKKLSILIQLLSVSFLIIPHGQQYRALLQKELEFSKIGKVESFSFFFGVICTVSVALYYPMAISAIYGYLINSLCRTILFSMYGSKMYRPNIYFSFSKIRSNIKFGAYLTADNLVNFINTNVSTAILAKLLGAVSVGGYNLAYNMTVVPPMKINPIITRVLFPAFSKIQDDKEKLRVNFYKLLSIIGLINFPLILGLAIVSHNFVLFMFGEQWEFITPIFQILCCVGLLRSIGNPIGSLLMAKARVDISLKFNIFKTVLFIPSMIIGGMLYGAFGVACGFLLVQILNTYLSYFILIKPILGASYKEYIFSILMPFKLTFPMMVFVFVYKSIVSSFIGNNLILFSSVILGGVVFLFTILISKESLVVELKKIIFKRF